MVETIIWTKTVQRTFDGIIDYFLQDNNRSTAEKFFFQVYGLLDKIQKQPTRYRPIPRYKTMRYAVFGKHYEMYYRIVGKSLIISDFFDTRQDPDKRPF